MIKKQITIKEINKNKNLNITEIYSEKRKEIVRIYGEVLNKILSSKRNILNEHLEIHYKKLAKKINNQNKNVNPQRYTQKLVNMFLISNYKNFNNLLGKLLHNKNELTKNKEISNETLKANTIKSFVNKDVSKLETVGINLPLLIVSPFSIFKFKSFKKLIRALTYFDRQLAEDKKVFYYYNDKSKIHIANLFYFLYSVFYSMRTKILISLPNYEHLPEKIIIRLLFFVLNVNSGLYQRKKKRFYIKLKVKKKGKSSRYFKQWLFNKKNIKKTKNTYISLLKRFDIYRKTIFNFSIWKQNLFKRNFVEKEILIWKKNLKSTMLKLTNNKRKKWDAINQDWNKMFLKYNKNKLFLITQIISNYYRKPVEMLLIRLHYPFYDSNIIVTLLGLLINEKKLRRLRRRLFKRPFVRNPYTFNRKFKPTKRISYVRGLHLRVSGYVASRKAVAKWTVQKIYKGAISRGKTFNKDIVNFTGKSKRGAWNINLKMAQNLYI